MDFKNRKQHFIASLFGLAAMQAYCSATADETPSKYGPLPGETVGMLVGDTGAALAAEGRAGPADAVLFSRDGTSYRWLYLTAKRDERGEPVTVEVGAKRGEEQTFENAVFATSEILSRRGITALYAVVEVQVNAGKGSPATDRFVATKLRLLEGTPDFPPRTENLVQNALQRCRAEPPSEEAEHLFKRLGQEALPGNAPFERNLLITPHITWLSQERSIDVSCSIALIGQERRPSIGIVPEEFSRIGGIGTSGMQFGVTWSRSFAITATGRVDLKTETPIVPFSHMVPPRSGAAPAR